MIVLGNILFGKSSLSQKAGLQINFFTARTTTGVVDEVVFDLFDRFSVLFRFDFLLGLSRFLSLLRDFFTLGFLLFLFFFPFPLLRFLLWGRFCLRKFFFFRIARESSSSFISFNPSTELNVMLLKI